MESVLQDLWPPDIAQSASYTAPATILKAQAAALASRTQNVISGEVRSSSEGGTIWHSFLIRAIFIDDFRYKLLSVRHAVTAYPAIVEHIYEMTGDIIECPCQSDFEQALREIFSSEAVHELVGSLLAQSVS